jgi:2-polyprenyl-3-methyl-5-hydroxy-6-metoxy-1,4-benzoquinol methylase
MNMAPDQRSLQQGSGRPCPACDQRPAASDKPSPVICAACGLVFVDPVPPEAISITSYGADYYEPWQGREERARIRMWRHRLAVVMRRSRGGTLLDVGCGDGLFLRVARDAGFRVEGIEFSPEGARRAAARLGRPVAVGDLALQSHLSGPFDIVTHWHVLEHLEAPRAMLEAARRRLAPGGLLVVAVPNLDNLPMQAAYRLARGRPLPLYEEGAREPHLSHFNPKTLRRLLERHQFETIDIVPDRCALTVPKRLIDSAAAGLTSLLGRILTDAIVAFARRSV